MKKVFCAFYLLIFCEFIGASKYDASIGEAPYVILGESDIEYDCKGQKCIQNYPPEAYPANGIMLMSNNSKNNADGNSTLQQTSTLIAKFIDNIPDKKIQNGLREYVKIVNSKAYLGDASVGLENHGLNAWFDNKFKYNQCYKNAAISFYRDVALTLAKENKCDSQPRAENLTNEYGCFEKRPSINDTAGRGRKSYLHEGWLLQLAMKYSQGSVEGAIELIGMCGHDDTSQGSFYFYDSSESAKAEIKAKLDVYKKEKKDVDENLKKVFKKIDSKNEEFYKLSRKSEKLLKKINELQTKNEVKRRLYCPPQNSDFYLPGSVGSGVDIPQNLKNRISSIQNPDGINFIPAKNYHIYGSAFLGCKMVVNGLSSKQAVMVQKQAARLYRGIRMCESVKANLIMRKNLSKSQGDIENTKEIETKIIALWTKINQKKIKCYNNIGELGGFGYPVNEQESNGFNKSQKKLSSEELKICETLVSFGISNLEPSEIDIVRSKIAKAYVNYDAALLYNKWYFGGNSILGKTLPCTDFRFRGPKDLMNPDRGILSNLSKPAGWSDERYKAATQKLATWDVDFEWTIKQHEVGSTFGASICSSNSKPNPFMDEKRCLKSANTSYYNYNSDKSDASENEMKQNSKVNSSRSSR